MIISPSLVSGDLMHAADEIRFICRNFDELHLDIEDGVHLPNISVGFRFAREACALAEKPVSLHLMVSNPLCWLEDVRQCGAAYTFLHLDHVRSPGAVLSAYRAAGVPVGLGLSGRDLRGGEWEALLPQVETALVLTSDIDDTAQPYRPEMAAFAMELAQRPNLRVWVDGAVDFPALEELSQAGIHAAVMGRAIFRDKKAACRMAGKWSVRN